MYAFISYVYKIYSKVKLVYKNDFKDKDIKIIAGIRHFSDKQFITIKMLLSNFKNIRRNTS
jgi:hypothetical protein